MKELYKKLETQTKNSENELKSIKNQRKNSGIN